MCIEEKVDYGRVAEEWLIVEQNRRFDQNAHTHFPCIDCEYDREGAGECGMYPDREGNRLCLKGVPAEGIPIWILSPNGEYSEMPPRWLSGTSYLAGTGNPCQLSTPLH